MTPETYLATVRAKCADLPDPAPYLRGLVAYWERLKLNPAFTPMNILDVEYILVELKKELLNDGPK